MRLDHIAYRVKDRHKTANFFVNAFGYRLAEGEGLTDGGFKISFPDGTTADCLVLEPPEKVGDAALIASVGKVTWLQGSKHHRFDQYHLAPEIFISDGAKGSIVGNWVEARSGIGGIHHLAYQVDDVEATMADWKDKGYAEFMSDKPLTCPGLTQVFSKPSELTGVIFELIKRDTQGFCKENVKDLMESTKGL